MRYVLWSFSACKCRLRFYEYKAPLIKDTRQIVVEWCGIPFKFNENGNFILIGQFDMDGNDYEDTISSYDEDEKNERRSFVFLNEYFKKGLDLQHGSHTFRKTYIDGEMYYYLITTLYLGKKIFIPLNPTKMNFLSQRLKSCRSFHQILNML